MAELIASIILGVSLCGAFFIVGRKIPTLLELPNIPPAPGPIGLRASILNKTGQLLRRIPFLKNFSWETWVEKKLSKARVLALKTDNKITGYLTALHVWEEEKKNGFSGNTTRTNEYWSDVKKYVKTKTGLRIKPLEPKPESGDALETKKEPDKAAVEPVRSEESAAVAVLNIQKDRNRTKRSRRRFQKKSSNW